jgi:hypothetical protein
MATAWRTPSGADDGPIKNGIELTATPLGLGGDRHHPATPFLTAVISRYAALFLFLCEHNLRL